MEDLTHLQKTYFTYDIFFNLYPNKVERDAIWKRMRKVGINPKWHDAIPVCCGNNQAMVDVKISSLILRFWSLGIETSNSCEGEPNENVWLIFKSEHCRRRAIDLMKLESTPHATKDYTHATCGDCFLLEFSTKYREWAITNIGDTPFPIVRY